jgi:hypothetical protein
MTDKEKARTWGLGTFALIAVMAAFLAFVIWALVQVWGRTSGVHITLAGWIALGLGVGLTVLVGGGLMRLAFLSDTKGYDDQVQNLDED